jgi:hypothetical protein
MGRHVDLPAQRLNDTFSSDAWDTDVIDSSVDELGRVLRATAEPELVGLAERIEALQT